MFLDDQGRPVQWPRNAFRAAVRRAGIQRNVRLHDLRHTALSNLARRNAPPVVIQRLAGHASLRMTSHYLHTDDDFMISEVIAASERPDPMAKQGGEGDPIGDPLAQEN
ncbi:MAG: tyrosine-type recombinase/integrase [Planctomycetota bacterium]